MMAFFKKKQHDKDTILKFMLQSMVEELPAKLEGRSRQLLVESWLFAGSIATAAALESIGALTPLLRNWEKMGEQELVRRLLFAWELFTFIALFHWAKEESATGDVIKRWAWFVFGLFNSPEERKLERVLFYFNFYMVLGRQIMSEPVSGVSRASNDLTILWIRTYPGGDKDAYATLSDVLSHEGDEEHFPVKNAVGALALGIPSLHPLESVKLSTLLSQADKVGRDHIQNELSK